jgi:hypothetical protein
MRSPGCWDLCETSWNVVRAKHTETLTAATTEKQCNRTQRIYVLQVLLCPMYALSRDLVCPLDGIDVDS